jgi:multiple antibiotic resistance protein
VQTVDADVIARVVIGLLVITSPFDPVKPVFFNNIVDEQQLSRTSAALKLTVYVSVILAIAALVGKELLEVVGIDLDAFGAVGGIVIAGMGFEMLYGGGASKAPGEEAPRRATDC